MAIQSRTAGHEFDFAGFRFFCGMAFALIAALIIAGAGSSAALGTLFAAEEAVPDALSEPSPERSYSVSSAQAFSLSLPTFAPEPAQRISSRTISLPGVSELMPEEGKFIAADLVAMRLLLYEDGVRIAAYPILSKGRPGSFWETPTGLYSILTKEESHFSSIGQVYMPYSMQFFGNFFVHGWPTYADGSPVEPGYSGGCIRLSTEDAAEVFSFAAKKTPLFVYEESGAPEQVSTFAIADRPLPEVSAAAFLLGDARSGAVFAEKDAHSVRPIASITKLMTAVVANEVITFDRYVAVASSSGARMADFGRITAGQAYRALDLLYPLLMESNNAVANALAASYGTRDFVTRMNAKADALGLPDTSFEDPSGISAKNVSTAVDLFAFARHLLENRTFVLSVSRTASKSVAPKGGEPVAFQNFNHFAADARFLGGKTGHTTAAKDTMLSLFEIPVGNATATVAVIVLGSEDRFKDTERLVKWFSGSASPWREEDAVVSGGVY